MSENTLEAKQQYLRENIIEAGYDPEVFVEFCSKTHDLDDLENWSMNQLVSIVRNFTHLNKGGVEDREEEFGGFQETPLTTVTQEISHPAPVEEKKMALVFSDDDWKHFLSNPAVTGQSSGGNHLPQDLLFDIGLSSSPVSTIQKDEKSKESPLSPPSIQNKTSKPQKKVQTSSKEVTSVQESSLPGTVIVDIPQKKSSKDIKENAINLSNIKILTAKEKLQPLLPLINDVVVTKTEQVSRNFLQSDFTLYHISFPPTQHVVKRKFTDLRKVRSLLQKYYPFLRLPYLEPEGWLNSSEGKDPQSLAKYKCMVEQFIRFCILKSKQLKDCELVRILCGLSLNGEKDDLKKKIQALENASKPKFLSEVVLTDNTIIIPPVSSCDRLVANTTTLMGQLDIQYQKLRKQIDYLFSTYDILSKNFLDISNTFETLQSLTKKYNFDNNQSADIRIFQGLREMTVKIANQINSDYSIFKNKVKNLFMYEKHNMTTLREIIQARNKVHYQYQRQGSPPFTSSSLRIQGSNVEIESPVPMEQPIRNNKDTLALQEAFWSFVVSRQTARYWEYLRKKISEHLTLIAYDQLDGENQNLNFWNSMIKRCVV